MHGDALPAIGGEMATRDCLTPIRELSARARLGNAHGLCSARTGEGCLTRDLGRAVAGSGSGVRVCAYGPQTIGHQLDFEKDPDF